MIYSKHSEVNGKGAHKPKAQTEGAYPGFISMKHLGVLLLLPWRDTGLSQGYLPDRDQAQF